MKITKYPASLINVNISGGGGVSTLNVSSSSRPYALVQETQLTVNAVVQLIATPPAGQSYTFMLINRSAAAQILRTGFAPSFAAPITGVSSLVGEVVIWENVNFGLSVIASAAGALADCLVLSQVL